MHRWLLFHSSQCVVAEMMSVVANKGRIQDGKKGKTHPKKVVRRSFLSEQPLLWAHALEVSQNEPATTKAPVGHSVH